MTNGEFNLRDLIRTVCADATELNLSKLVVEVDQKIRPEHRDAALRQALPAVVHDVVHSQRGNTTIRTQDGRASVTRLPGRSTKVAGIRDYWRKALQEMYSVDRAGGLKRLADLTREDLRFNIETREELARRNKAKALELQRLLDLVNRHGVATVGELPEQVLADTLVRAA